MIQYLVGYFPGVCIGPVGVGKYLVEFLLGDVGFVLCAEGTEGTLNLLTGLHVFCLTADHERHVLLQRHVPIPAHTRAPVITLPTTSVLSGLSLAL